MRDRKVKNVVSMAFFAAVTFLGIQVFRIPVPAAVGTPFIHFGHVFVVLGMLLQGGKRGAASGTAGLVIFDLLNGFVQSIPQVFCETIIKCLLVGALFSILKERAKNDRKKEWKAAVLCAVVYAALNIVIEWTMQTILLLVTGSGFAAAAAASTASIPATVVNAVFMAMIVSILYMPAARAYRKFI